MNSVLYFLVDFERFAFVFLILGDIILFPGGTSSGMEENFSQWIEMRTWVSLWKEKAGKSPSHTSNDL